MNDENELRIFCENVKRLREESGLSKKEMAKIMAIGVKRLNRIETGDFPKTLKTSAALRLAQHFNITLKDLFT
jgi:DNA-binding XRE family transcriptional regulator